MHIVIMLVLIIVGYMAGSKISWLLGLPIMALGALAATLMGSTRWKHQQEDVWILLGLLSTVAVIVAATFGL
ncbi:hypothetical protein L2725_10980 [Shewanella corallii]|uniref:Uncharacterized protein n=1 Tax=Shewanella corallii TaxID=560080 RepID=A0ABT0N769_9GAMM|nr:hypothetical protein [Shewanella corallii]MCL2914291.1 hypothetical protein [Shewanella corallii]